MNILRNVEPCKDFVLTFTYTNVECKKEQKPLSKRELNRIQKAAELAEVAKSRGARVLGDYINNSTKVSMICSEGHKFSIIPDSYKRSKNSGCRACEGNCPIQAEQDFRKAAASRNARVVGEYKNVGTKVSMICKEGHKFSISPSTYKSGVDCAKCSGQCSIQAEDGFRKAAESRGARVVGEYKNTDTKVSMICSEGHKFSIQPSSYKRGHDCLKCSGRCPIQSEADFRREAESRGAVVLGEYIKNDIKVDMICSEGHKFSIQPSSYKSGDDCAICSNQFKKYEEHTASTLTQLGVRFEREFRVDTAKTFRRIDFVLPDYDIFIEVDEKHHKSQSEEDVQREENIMKALSNTMYQNFTFERVDATQGKTQEERFDNVERQVLEIIQKHS